MPCTHKSGRKKFCRREDYKTWFKVNDDWTWVLDEEKSLQTSNSVYGRVKKNLRLRSGESWLDENPIKSFKGPRRGDRYRVTKTFEWCINRDVLDKKRCHCSPEMQMPNKKTCFKLFVYPALCEFFTKKKNSCKFSLKCLDGCEDRDYLYCISLKTSTRFLYCVDEYNQDVRLLKHNFEQESNTTFTPSVDISKDLEDEVWVRVELW